MSAEKEKRETTGTGTGIYKEQDPPTLRPRATHPFWNLLAARSTGEPTYPPPPPPNPLTYIVRLVAQCHVSQLVDRDTRPFPA